MIDARSAAIDMNGDLWTWGYGNSGRLGHGDEFDQMIPKPIESLRKNVRHVSCGNAHGGASLKSGGVVMWGWSRNGQTGLGFTNEACLKPVCSFPCSFHLPLVFLANPLTLSSSFLYASTSAARLYLVLLTDPIKTKRRNNRFVNSIAQ